jgi:hypothetical protein
VPGQPASTVEEIVMLPKASEPMLRRVLWFDAATCALAGIALLLLAGPVESWLALPVGLSRAAGVVLLLFAAEVAWVAGRARLPRTAVWAVVAANVLWAIASIVALVAGWLTPNTLGTAFVVAQAVAVAVIAELEVLGLRRTAPA